MASSKSKALPFHVAYGNEPFLLDLDIEKARQWPNRVFTLLDGDDVDEQGLVSFLESSPMDGGRRTIVLDNAQKVKGSALLKEHIDEKNLLDLSTIFLVVVRSEKLPDVWARMATRGKSYEIRKKFRPWETDKVATWVKHRASDFDVTLAKDVEHIIVKAVGTDLYSANNELRKLASYVGVGGVITADAVRLLSSAIPTVTVFQVAEAAAAKNRQAAMNALSLLYKTQGDDISVPMTSALMKQVERLLITRQMLQQKASAEDIATATGVARYLCETTLIPCAKKHEMRALVQHMGRLCKLDMDVKGPARSKRTLVELTVLAVAG